MRDALRMEIKGIKCDNPECDYINMKVELKDYDKWLNKPCPKCGEILLTEEDYNSIKFMMELTNKVSKVFPKMQDNEEDIKVHVEMNGTGEMKFK